MKRTIWIALLTLSLAALLAACGGGQAAPSDAQQQADSSKNDAASLPTAEPKELPPDSPGAIFQQAMAGVETDVMPFIEGIPTPDQGTTSIATSERLEFITTLSIEEAAQFYRDTFTQLGLVEIEELTEESEFSIRMVFGGYPGGKAVRVSVVPVSKMSNTIKVNILNPEDL